MNAVSIRSYKHSALQKDVMEKMTQELLNAGFIQHNHSPFFSPMVVVKKKDGSWRMCIDYKELNKGIVKDKYLIPVVKKLLDELHSSSLYSKIDLRVGYHQIRMDSLDVHKTAFRTHSGHYEFLVMPFDSLMHPLHFRVL